MEYDKSSLEILPINKDTWNMSEDEELIMKLDKNSALLVVHNLGNIININRIKKIRPDIVIVEDNCEGVFGEYEGIKSGCSSNSLCSSVSFYGNKTITTGEGGAFITNEKDVYNFIKRIYSQGMSEERYIHNIMAYNYRMTNVQAAFLYDQLNDIYNILKRKQKLFDNYNSLFQDLIDNKKVELQKVNQNTKRANWMYAVKIVNNSLNPKETFEYFKNKNIETRPFFYPYHKHEHLKNIKTYINEDFESVNLNRQIVMIPSSPMIKYEDQVYIVNCIKEFTESL
jgi:perosamine synthetase